MQTTVPVSGSIIVACMHTYIKKKNLHKKRVDITISQTVKLEFYAPDPSHVKPMATAVFIKQ